MNTLVWIVLAILAARVAMSDDDIEVSMMFTILTFFIVAMVIVSLF